LGNLRWNFCKSNRSPALLKHASVPHSFAETGKVPRSHSFAWGAAALPPTLVKGLRGRVGGESAKFLLIHRRGGAGTIAERDDPDPHLGGCSPQADHSGPEAHGPKAAGDVGCDPQAQKKRGWGSARPVRRDGAGGPGSSLYRLVCGCPAKSKSEKGQPANYPQPRTKSKGSSSGSPNETPRCPPGWRYPNGSNTFVPDT
jgi:hypothetical protein